MVVLRIIFSPYDNKVFLKIFVCPTSCFCKFAAGIHSFNTRRFIFIDLYFLNAQGNCIFLVSLTFDRAPNSFYWLGRWFLQPWVKQPNFICSESAKT